MENKHMELEKILNTGDISTVFQPIVNLTNGTVLGYEALSRGPHGSPLQFPDALFAAASECNRTWDLESLCRTKAIERAAHMDKNKYLFLNVDPHIFKDENFKKGFTKEFLSKHDISPKSIIFEITEKTSIEDYKGFRAALDHYINQGYKIAIDDTGSGYSGLKMLSETKPHFVKIDMDLIRNININQFNQALIKCFVTLADVTGMKLIAEGIETEAELLALIDLGVYAGQGYFLQRPVGTFLNIPESVNNIIVKHNIMTNKELNLTDNNYIGQIVKKTPSYSENTICSEIKDYLDKNDMSGVCIIKCEEPVGLIMKHTLNSALATQFGVSIFSKRPIKLVMNKEPLIVDFYSTVTEVSKAAMSRSSETIYDYVIVTKDSKYYGIVTIKNLLEHTTMLECNYAKELNPLTGLPGNTIIDRHLSKIRHSGKLCCVLYFDLDNFKAYNDTYGFENGDKIIKFTSALIQSKLIEMFSSAGFLGHIGGDDFVCIIEGSLEKCNLLCQSIIVEFDRKISDFFNEKDKLNNYIESIGRTGKVERFNITAISIAGLYTNFNDFSNTDRIAQYMSALKKEAKSIKGSSFILRED
jgi:diguanylate cyclase (GGDEF)-like protein